MSDDLLGPEEAARLLEVTPDRLGAMVEGGLLTPVDRGTGRQYRRAEVLALRELGG